MVQGDRHCLATQVHGIPVRDSAEDRISGYLSTQQKPTNGLLVRNHTSIVCGKTEVLPDGAFGLEARAHDLVIFTCSRHLQESTLAESKLKMMPNMEYLLLFQIMEGLF